MKTEQIPAEGLREELEEPRFRALVEQAQAIIFEWDIESDTIYVSPAFEREFGCRVPNQGFRKAILEANVFHEEDKQRLRELLLILQSKRDSAEAELRVRSRGGEYRWCKIKATAVLGTPGELLRVVGVLSDIDAYKRENALLAALAQRDPLTGLLNQATFRAIVDDFLKNAGKNGRHALFLLDAGGTKGADGRADPAPMNDQLCEVARGLREKFREDDVLGHLTGDKFAILLKNPSSHGIIEKKAKLIQELLRAFCTEGRGRPPGSVGVAVYPEDGATPELLLEHADKALAAAKRSGKKRPLFYAEIK